MKHRLFNLVAFLFLGAILNIAVAWGCAKWSDWLAMVPWLETHLTTSAPAAWQLDHMPKNWPDKPAYAASSGTGWSLLTDQVSTRDDEVFILHVFRFGVPTKSLASYWLAAQSPSMYWDEWRYASRGSGGEYSLPLRPIWPAFAINTLFYATVLWLLALALFTARRIVRRRHGHCPQCGYKLRWEFTAGCPECGWRRENVP